MRRFGIGVLLVSAVLFAGGCAFFRSIFGGFREPELSFDRADLQGVTLTGADLNLHWLLRNDNPIGLKLASVSYALSVEDHPLLAGKPPNGLQVRAEGSTPLSFPAHVEFRALEQTLETFLTKDVARYTASGSVGISTPLGVLTLPLSHSGTFPVPKLPEISLMTPSVNSFTLQGAHITLPISVRNRNGFALPFTGMGGSVTLAGAPVFAPALAAQSNLGPNERRVVNLGIDVNFMQTGMAVANALRSGVADVGYHGSLNIAGYQMPINVQQRVAFH